MDLNGKVAVVTGGARGIGRGMAIALARQGVQMAVADLYTPQVGTAGYASAGEQEVMKTVDEIAGLGVKAIGVPVDVTDWERVEAMVEAVTQQLGPIDILCNNAGVVDVENTGDNMEAAFDQLVSGLMPLGRPQTPEDIGQAVVYLAQADIVTGIALNVAGGRVMD